MRKTLLILFSLAGTIPAFADFTIALNAGQLEFNSSTPMATGTNGALLLVLDLGSSGVLSPVDAGSYVSGTNFVLAAVTFNNFGGANQTQNTIDVTTPANVGDKIVLEWFPDSTLADYNADSGPTSGDPYGAVDPNGAAISGGSAWEAPSSGTIDLNFYTSNSAGPVGDRDQSPSAGYANYTVAPAVTPEPPIYALLLSALPLFAWNYRRQIRVRLASR